MATVKITSEDRLFFSLVMDATFANPFSQKRLDIDTKISGSEPGRAWIEVRPEAIGEVKRRIEKLAGDKPVSIQAFNAADQELMMYVFLFDLYHQFSLRFDDVISAQVKAGPQSVQVPFAAGALDTFCSRGFERKEACRFFSLFYQIRRAFYLIEKALVGQSDCMRQLRVDLWNNIFTCEIDNFEKYLWDRMEDFSTLLLGPTGSGKGAAAAAIGRSGFIPFDEKKGTFAKSFTETFVPINLSQYPETLLESELFGHTKGAFTGAVGEYRGLFSLCGEHGSVFLDEIGEIRPEIQIKLLKVLEERAFTPVGSHDPLRFHGRVIAATHRNLDELRDRGAFRDDFYYRLCSDCIRVPSLQQRLRENPVEMNDLIAHTIRWITGRDLPELAAEVRKIIDQRLGNNYPWPGNVRELGQCVRRIIIKRDYEGHLPGEPADRMSQLSQGLSEGTLKADELLMGYCRLLHERFGTYEEVARRTGLDRRTVKKYIQTQNLPEEEHYPSSRT
ncbi:MAG: sigma-54-dependent Fis family transcriptional regulator [Sedimentisphaerales bacterium]|nr:sigma-54-dependent Fis family transcriptional regulator [Sedimentisphaerales bacterium]